jgi:hypothetical protein
VFEFPIGGWDSNAFWRIDSNGNEVAAQPVEEEPPDSYKLNDFITDEPRYEVRIRREIVETEYGLEELSSCSLWDLEGNMLLDYGKYGFSFAIGDYVRREYDSGFGPGYYYDDELPPEYYTEMYHVPTGEAAFPGAWSAGLMQDGRILMLGRGGVPMGYVNAEGEALSGFPMPGTYYDAAIWNNCIVASTVNPYDRDDESGTAVLLDADLNTLFTADWMSHRYHALRGDYLYFREGEREGIYAMEPGQAGGEIFSVDGADIRYFDGELAVTQTGSFRGDEQIDAKLETVNHETLAEGFSWLVEDSHDGEDLPAEGFIGIKGSKAVIIGRNGETLASSVELPNVRNINSLCEGLYTCLVEEGESAGEGLLNAEMEIVVPVGKYTGFSAFDGGNGIIEGLKHLGSEDERLDLSIYRVDILDSAGNVIMDNVTSVLGYGENRLAIERGFSYGLIDFEGNWIARRSIFSGSLQD